MFQIFNVSAGLGEDLKKLHFYEEEKGDKCNVVFLLNNFIFFS